VKNLTEVVQKVLSNNRWGIYYKENPIESLKAQDGVMVIRVNRITSADFIIAINKALEESIDKEIK
jgi:hypothetical protein